MTQEQQIIEYLELNGPKTGRAIAQALSLKSIATTLKRSIASGAVTRCETPTTLCRRDMALYSVAGNVNGHPAPRTVKAVQGMAPPVPEGFNPANPFQLRRA